MTPNEKELIQTSFAAISSDADATAALFYRRLFELDPSLQPMFRIGLKTQGKKFMTTLKLSLSHLDQLDKLVPVLWQLGKRHGGYGVKDEQYDTVAVALLWTLERQLGDAFTPEMESAWAKVYELMATTMKQAAMEGIIPRSDSLPIISVCPMTLCPTASSA